MHSFTTHTLCQILSHWFFVRFCFLFCSPWDWTQGLVHVGKVLYCSSTELHPPSPNSSFLVLVLKILLFKFPTVSPTRLYLFFIFYRYICLIVTWEKLIRILEVMIYSPVILLWKQKWIIFLNIGIICSCNSLSNFW